MKERATICSQKRMSPVSGNPQEKKKKRKAQPPPLSDLKKEDMVRKVPDYHPTMVYGCLFPLPNNDTICFLLVFFFRFFFSSFHFHRKTSSKHHQRKRTGITESHKQCVEIWKNRTRADILPRRMITEKTFLSFSFSFSFLVFSCIVSSRSIFFFCSQRTQDGCFSVPSSSDPLSFCEEFLCEHFYSFFIFFIFFPFLSLSFVFFYFLFGKGSSASRRNRTRKQKQNT